VPGALPGAAAVTLALTSGRRCCQARYKAGPVYGSFATVAGMFALLYLVNQALSTRPSRASATPGRGRAPWT